MAPELGINAAYHSMNVGVADLNGDGFPEVYISNIATMVKDNKYVLPDLNTPLNFDPQAMAGMLVKESNMLYMSMAEEGALVAYQPSSVIERGETTTGWAWDAEFFDFDNDGDLDLYCVNGSNEYNMFFSMVGEEKGDGVIRHYYFNHDGQSNVMFESVDGRLKNVSSRSGADFVGNSRAAVYLDWDGDGDLDIAVNNFHRPATLLRNDCDRFDRRWVRVRLVGGPGFGGEPRRDRRPPDRHHLRRPGDGARDPGRLGLPVDGAERAALRAREGPRRSTWRSSGRTAIARWWRGSPPAGRTPSRRAADPPARDVPRRRVAKLRRPAAAGFVQSSARSRQAARPVGPSRGGKVQRGCEMRLHKTSLMVALSATLRRWSRPDRPGDRPSPVRPVRPRIWMS